MTPLARSRAQKKQAKPRLFIDFGLAPQGPLSRKDFDSVLQKIFFFFPFAPQNLELVFVTSAESQKLNRLYRKKNKPTDVLSFESDREDFLGSIVIDFEVASEQAQFYRHSFRRECLELFIHGCLHLLGFDHENEAEAFLMKSYENHMAAECLKGIR